jgi:hypothetical protein
MENLAQMHSLTPKSKKRGSVGTIIGFFFLVIVLGIGTGFGLNLMFGSGGGNTISSGKIYGSNDIGAFKDTAEGTLESGGINGEGEYHLVRVGGESQNVYLTSSSVDLSIFVGKKIKVWGQTQEGQTAGWLMDVGRVEVL